MELPQIQADWYEKGLRFSCTQCGNCCTGPPGFVWISQEEVRRLASHLGISVEDTVDKYCRIVAGRLSLKENQNPAHGGFDCVFLREEGSRRTCAVYPARPAQCRAWPFWPGNLASKEAWDLAGRRCPGMGSGRVYSRAEIRALAGDESK